MPLNLPFKFHFAPTKKKDIATIKTILHTTFGAVVYGHTETKDQFELTHRGTSIAYKDKRIYINWSVIGAVDRPLDPFLIGNPYAFKTPI